MYFKRAGVRHLAVLAWAVVVAGACGGKVDESSRSASTVPDCNSFCNRMLAPRCANDNLAQCLTDCQSLPSQICSELRTQFFECAVVRAKYLCAGDHAAMQGCDAEAQNFLTCANANAPDAGGKDATSGG